MGIRIQNALNYEKILAAVNMSKFFQNNSNLMELSIV